VPLKQPTAVPESPDSDAKFILLGEDDIDDEELLKEVFSQVDSSFNLVFVNNGKDVIPELEKMAGGKLPCLIILDYNMPSFNGSEILRELMKHSRYNSIPKIIWSTSNSTTYKEQCLELGACDYVTKPSSMRELVEVARYMLSFCSVH
jgi:DNA-binding response OmpR family regulator